MPWLLNSTPVGAGAVLPLPGTIVNPAVPLGDGSRPVLRRIVGRREVGVGRRGVPTTPPSGRRTVRCPIYRRGRDSRELTGR